MRYIKGAVLAVICLLSVEAFSQQAVFRHLIIDDGLSQNAVYSILQDSHGYMWFGTKDGLNRYDGRNFVIYQHNPFDSTTISDPYVITLYEDSKGRIWTGSFFGEINIFHRDTDSFQRISLINEIGEEIASSEITAITEGDPGTMWIGTKSDGLLKITAADNQVSIYSFTQYLNDAENEQSPSSNEVSNLLVDENKTLWVGTEEGLNEFHADRDLFTRTIFETKHPEAPQISGDYRISSMHTGPAEDDFWIGTQSGLVKFDRHSGSYDFFPSKFEVFRYGEGSINRIVEDHTGQLWLGTYAGLMRFDPLTKNYTYYQHDPLDPQSLNHNLISSLLIDNTGILWAGTSGLGINILDFKANRFPSLFRNPDPASRIPGFSIQSILEDNSGDVWISADVLYRWNRQTGELSSFESSIERPQEFGNAVIYSIIQASDGHIWAAAPTRLEPERLFRHHPLTGETTVLIRNQNRNTDPSQKEVLAVIEDRDGTIWAANRHYFSKFTGEDEAPFIHFSTHESDPANQTDRPVIFQDMERIFWLGTVDGLIRFDPVNESFQTYINNPEDPKSLSNNHIKSILEDPAEPETYLWIGTSGGLNKLNYRTGTFKHYMEQDGLPNDVVYGVLPDADGNLWLSTNKGLSRFNLQSETFRNYDVQDGLQSNEFNTGAYFRSKSGELFFGGIQGLNYFYPENIKDNPHQPPVVLTGIKLGNQPISNKTDPELISASVSAIDQITFSHRNDVITFEFAALDYSSPDKNQYAYIMEGYNDDWIMTGNLASATFTNLPHGKYTFRVKGSNNDGIWNEEGLALAVMVTPPWWHTWWAYGLYMAFFLTALYSLRRYELNRFNLKNQLKLEKVQSDTLRNLDHLKSQFFANISHEFRTPLTLLVGQIETLLYSEPDRKRKEKLISANQNIDRLLHLINQLLDLSKLEAGKMELDPDEQNMVSFLKNHFFSFESLAEAGNISLNFSSSRARITMNFDQDKMEKVFYNLFSNACKFTGPGGRIDVAVNIPQPDIVEIRVKDSGIGISEERLPYIFDRFYQADSSNTRKYEGTGIGLSLAYELIALHHGTIDVNSEEGVGTEFIIRLPYQADLDSDSPDESFSRQVNGEAASPVTEETNAEGLLSDNGELVLIVEDNKEVRTFIRDQLCEDYNILEAANGLEGIAVSRDTIPDLIITDLMMPEMDGHEFSVKIRGDEKTSHIPIIMLTAKAGQAPKIEGLEAGVDAYLTKPFHVKELQIRVKALIEQRKNLKKRFSSATYFKPSVVAKSSVDQSFISRAIEIIDNRIADEDFLVEDFAELLNMSASQLNRKLNALIDQPAGTFIRSVKLQRGAELLNQTNKTVSEICFEVGFNEPSYFARAFKKQFGKSPKEFRKISI